MNKEEEVKKLSVELMELLQETIGAFCKLHTNYSIDIILSVIQNSVIVCAAENTIFLAIQAAPKNKHKHYIETCINHFKWVVDENFNNVSEKIEQIKEIFIEGRTI
jgi:hypothetical protein